MVINGIRIIEKYRKWSIIDHGLGCILLIADRGDWSFMVHGSRGTRFMEAYFVLEYYGSEFWGHFAIQTLHSVCMLLYICRVPFIF